MLTMYSTGMHFIMYYNYDIHFILSGINTAQIGQYATHCRMARHTHFHLALPSTSQDLSPEGTSSTSSKGTAPNWNTPPSDCKDRTLAKIMLQSG